jgi:adenylate kinase
MNIILLGPPASGKGTQAEILAEHFKIPAISMGQILREQVKAKTEIGNEIEKILNSGELISNDLTDKLLWKRIEKDDCKNGFILDGFPRTRIQAKFLNEKINIDKVILIKVSDKEVINRLSGRRSCSKCGDIYHLEFNPPKQENICDECGGKLIHREDDTPKIIKERLKIYHTETEEVIEYYTEKNILIEVDGERDIKEIGDEIIKLLNG